MRLKVWSLGCGVQGVCVKLKSLTGFRALRGPRFLYPDYLGP